MCEHVGGSRRSKFFCATVSSLALLSIFSLSLLFLSQCLPLHIVFFLCPAHACACKGEEEIPSPPSFMFSLPLPYSLSPSLSYTHVMRRRKSSFLSLFSLFASSTFPTSFLPLSLSLSLSLSASILPSFIVCELAHVKGRGCEREREEKISLSLSLARDKDFHRAFVMHR